MKPTKEMNQAIERYKKMSIRGIFTYASRGDENAFKEECEIIETMKSHHKLNEGVLVALLDYQFEFKKSLDFGEIEKMLSLFNRKGINDIHGAMNEIIIKIREDKKKREGDATPVERVRYYAIEGAIHKGMDDKELGNFVREMFRI